MSHKINFISTLIILGSILIGFGILSFVASNWIYLSKFSKVIIIFITFASSIFASFKTQDKLPKTSIGLLYLSSMIYGAGIFLIGQIFNYGGDFSDAFLLWTIGVLAIAIFLNEKYLFIFSHVLFLIYLNSNFDNKIIFYPIIFLIIFYTLNRYFKNSHFITFMSNLVSLNFVLYLMNYFKFDALYAVSLFFIIGFLMFLIVHPLNYSMFKVQGFIVLGVSGLLLTISDLWEELDFIDNGDYFSIGFSILFLIYLLSLVRKGYTPSLIFICTLILRYYFDTFYDFLPKSAFFLLGGFILLGFGYYFEKLRKQKGGAI